MPGKRCIKAFLLTAILLTIAGCVSEKKTGARHVFGFNGIFPLVAVVGGGGIGFIGWKMTREQNGKTQAQGWGYLIGAPVMALLCLPSYFTNYVDVSPTRMKASLGLPFFIKKYDVDLNAVDRVETVIKQKKQRYGEVKDEDYIRFHFLDNRPPLEIEQERLLTAARPEIDKAFAAVQAGRKR